MKIDNLDKFEPYGRVLRSGTDVNTDLFVNEMSTGWKLAELPVTDGEILSMSFHDNTPEAFIPLEGTALLAVALKEDFSDCKLFLIDRPLMIYPSVWHGLAAPNGDARLLLVENRTVNLKKKAFPEERA